VNATGGVPAGGRAACRRFSRAQSCDGLSLRTPRRQPARRALACSLALSLAAPPVTSAYDEKEGLFIVALPVNGRQEVRISDR
jgi:hypothetical protein